MKKFNIGDIVFVANYSYKNNDNGQRHSFVIIDDGQAVDIDYFGFLLSSKLNKASYPYNEMLYKNENNNLLKDSIVKCDDLIKFHEDEVQFKIGSVTQEELDKFVDTYAKYIEEN